MGLAAELAGHSVGDLLALPCGHAGSRSPEPRRDPLHGLPLCFGAQAGDLALVFVLALFCRALCPQSGQSTMPWSMQGRCGLTRLPPGFVFVAA